MYQKEKSEGVHGAAGVVDEQGHEADIQKHDNDNGLINPVRACFFVMGQEEIAQRLEGDDNKDY